MPNHIDQVEEPSEALETTAACRERRRFSVEEKLRITFAARACKSRGELSELLRNEGITHSLLSTWRERLERHGLAGLATRRPGPRPTNDERERLIQRQRRAILELERELAIVKGLVEMQKKAHAILGISQPRIDDAKD